MTIGIYKLNFSGTNKVYIGKSLNIEYRYKGHLRSFRRGEASKKMREAHETYGDPTLEILEICKEEDIDDLENKYIAQYNSVLNGFNSRNESTGVIISNCGELNHKSKFSNTSIIECFDLLVDAPDMLFHEIEEITGVARGSVTMLARGVNHKWLKEYNPTKYAKLLELVGTRRSTCKTVKVQGITIPNIISPDGVEYKIDSIRQFCREHGLDQSALGRVLHGKAKTHKGWHL